MRKTLKKLVIYAVSAGVALSAQPVLAYHNPRASADQSLVYQVPADLEVVADGLARAKVVVEAKNENGQLMPNADVKITSSRGTVDTVIPSLAYTDQSGKAEFFVTSAHSGTSSFSATIEGDVVTAARAQVRFASVLYGPYSSAVGNPKAARANGRDTIQMKVLIKDRGGVPLEGRTITLTSNRPEDRITPAFAIANRDGVAYFDIKSTAPGSPQLDVKGDGEYVWAEQITFVKVPVDFYNSYADPTHVRSIADGTSAVTINATLRDHDNFPITGRRVTVTSNRGIVDTVTPGYADSDAYGLVSFELRSTQSGTTRLTLDADGTVLNVPEVMFMGAPSPEAIASPGLSTINPSSATVPADGASFVEVLVVARNAQGLPMTGKTVSLTSSRGSTDSVEAVVNPTSSRPDAPAAAIFRVRSTVAGTSTIHATINGVSIVPIARLTFNPAPLAVRPAYEPTPSVSQLPDTNVSSVASSISVGRVNAPADDETHALVTVSVKNSAGEPLRGKSVVLASSRMGSDKISPASHAVSNQNGIAEFRVTSKSPGESVFTAIADGVRLSDEARALFTLPGRQVELKPGDVFRGRTHAAVYYYGRDGKKYAFPNEKIYFTWYDSFAPVKVVPDTVAAAVPRANRSVHPRPGARLLQFVDIARDRRSYVIKSVKVYVLEPNGALRSIASPEVAQALYGPDWEQLIVPSLPGMNGYRYGEEIQSALDFNPAGVQSLVNTIDDDLGI